MEEKFAPTRAYIVYWDSQKRVIKQATMYAETLWPIPLTRAVKIFRPDCINTRIAHQKSF